MCYTSITSVSAFIVYQQEGKVKAACYDGIMSFLYYFNDCPTCKNHNRNLVRDEALHNDVQVDERYILALPDIWGKAVEEIGVPTPFLYDTKTKQALHVDCNTPNMAEMVRQFLRTP